jgi:hypothetical protein
MSKINPKSLKVGDAVCIHWEDASSGDSAWEDMPVGDKDIHGLQCRSLGFVVGKKKGFVMLFPHIAENDTTGTKHGCGDITIPLSCIVSVKRLNL